MQTPAPPRPTPSVSTLGISEERGSWSPERVRRLVGLILRTESTLFRGLLWESHIANAGADVLIAWYDPVEVAERNLSGGPIVAGPTQRSVGAFVGYWSKAANPVDAAVRGSGEGNFSCLAITSRGLFGRTSRSGTEPLYLGRRNSRVVLSSRARIASIALEEAAPALDGGAIPEFLSAGYALSNRTFYRDVVCVGPAVQVKVRKPRFRGVEVVVRREKRRSSSSRPEDVAAALVTSVEPLRAESGVVLSLTGGKDSRLIAAALSASGVSFRTQTSGWADDADVRVAGMVAKHLGIEHTFRAPTVITRDQQSSIEVDVMTRAVNAILLGEGHVSSYENLGNPRARDRAFAGLGGHGGELIRGGFAHYVQAPTGSSAAAYLQRAFLRTPQIFHDDARQGLASSVEQWKTAAVDDPLETLDDLYRRYRAGRWSASARSAYEQTRRKVQPFFDSAVVRTSEGAGREACVDERVVFETLDVLDPALARLPFAGSRYRFEAQGPHPSLPDCWTSREPIMSRRGTGATGFNWRVGYGGQLQQVFREVILDPGRDDDLFLYVKRERIEHLLSADPPTSQHLSWHLFTLAVLFSREWERDHPAGRTVSIPVP